MLALVLWDLVGLHQSMDRDNGSLAEKTAVTDQHPARLGSNEVPTVWTDSSDNTVNVPRLGRRVLNSNVSTRC